MGPATIDSGLRRNDGWGRRYALTPGIFAGILRRVKDGAGAGKLVGGLGRHGTPSERQQAADDGGAGDAQSQKAQNAAAGGAIPLRYACAGQSKSVRSVSVEIELRQRPQSYQPDAAAVNWRAPE